MEVENLLIYLSGISLRYRSDFSQSWESITIMNNKTRQDNATISQSYLNQGKTVFFVPKFYTELPKIAIDNTYVKPPIILPLKK